MQEDEIIRIEAENDGKRVDIILAEKLPECSRSALQHLLRKECITLNGSKTRPSQKVHSGDIIRYALQSLEEKVLPEKMNLDILYEDDELLVINKPAGVVVHPTPHEKSGTLVNGLLDYCSTDAFRSMMDDETRPGIVHRLDKDTSGALLVAKKPEIAASLKEMFQSHAVHKTYLAIVYGTMSPPEGDIQLPIGRHPRNKVKMAVVEDGGKEAWTEYKTIAANDSASLVKVRLHTGRTHQIRVHFAHFGHPVLGDILYGRLKGPYKPKRQLLHAWKLSFKHPLSGNVIKLTAPIPDDLQKYINLLRG